MGLPGLVDGRLVIGMTSDHAYRYPFSVALASFARHCSAPLDVRFALPQDWRRVLKERDREMIAAWAAACSAEFREVVCDIEATHLPSTLHIAPIAFVKPALFDALDVDTVVWLDSDAIAVADFSELAMAAPNAPIAGVHERNDAMEAAWGAGRRDWYVNTGVLTVHPTQWRECAGDWRALLGEYTARGFRWLDQDVINAAVGPRSALLEERWNVRPPYAAADVTIWHFAGWWKPWLRTRRQVRLLHALSARAFAAYADAEQVWQDIASGLDRPARAYWREVRRRTRGVLGWRAARHYVRGVTQEWRSDRKDPRRRNAA